MRAFESTGLLVALVYESGKAISFYLFFVLMAIIAFTQLFYTINVIVGKSNLLGRMSEPGAKRTCKMTTWTTLVPPLLH